MLRVIVRTVFALAALVLVVGGAIFLRTGLRLRAECYEAETAQVLDFAVDAGRVGEHRTTLKQIASFPCKQYIRIEPELRDGEDAASVLRGLELTVQVTDATGYEWLAGTYPAPWALDEHAASPIIVMKTPMWEGDYDVLVEVVSPAPALDGRQVRLVSGYVLCGIEWMGPTIAVGGGSVGIAIGALIGLVLWSTRRRAPQAVFPDVSVASTVDP